MAEASKDVNASYDAQAGATGRRLKGLGVNLTPEQQGAQQRSMGLSRSCLMLEHRTPRLN